MDKAVIIEAIKAMCKACQNIDDEQNTELSNKAWGAADQFCEVAQELGIDTDVEVFGYEPQKQ